MVENETYKVIIDDYDVNGYGVCHIDKLVVFVVGAMKDEEVIIRITNVHKKYAFSELVRVLKSSPFRKEPVCPYANLCGGCDLLHMDYSVEAKIKEKKVKDTFRYNDYKLNPTIKNDKEYGYRNKVMIPFARDEEDDVIYGFYEKNSHKIVSMDKCLISSDTANGIVYLINRYLNLFHISIYDELKHEGLFKEVMVRNTALNEYMVVLVTTKDADFSELIKWLTNEYKEIKSIYLNINPIKTNVVLSNEYKLLYGTETITEDILGLKFNVSPASFMQVNHDQCEKLYSEALRMAELKPNMNVIDAYCGMGSITLNIAKKVNHVYGIEIVPQAIENAKKNMELNGITNATFICGKCEDEIKNLVNREKIDCIFFDPPRKGCDKQFLDTVIKMNIPKIVYISCNIATCKRDIDYLKQNGYILLEATPTDLFTKTSHVESIALMVLRDDSKHVLKK